MAEINKNKDLLDLPSEKFSFANTNKVLHDKELVTKPISYFRDAWNRFKKNKGSIVASIVIIIIVLYAIIVPIFSQYSISYEDPYFSATKPKIQLFEKLGWNFMDGTAKAENQNVETFLKYYSMGVETGHNAVKNQKFEKVTFINQSGKNDVGYTFRLDYYHKNGVIIKDVTSKEYAEIQKYQDLKNVQIIYPITDPELRPKNSSDKGDGNFWYKTTRSASANEELSKTYADVTYDENGIPHYENIYLAYSGTDNYTSKMRIEGDQKLYDYCLKRQGTMIEIRVNYYEYYKYYHSYVLKDGITEPSFVFGTTSGGEDIFTCLAAGARFSFLFAIAVAAVNLIVGAIYGAIEGYYGGKTDLIMERISDILSAVPSMIVISLLKYHLPKNIGPAVILFVAFFATGWIGMASRTRMQFYRFKNQEYVLAARTLGASDKRIMFKHIFPNALGTLITGCVLIIPGMIFSETSLNYLGIIHLESSVGALLAEGKGAIQNGDAHIVLFPALFISLLMLSFNLFGNGLRDAFNPSLRGSED